MPTTIEADRCPRCDTTLTRLAEHEPWCPQCEWNLDHYADDPRASWFWRRMSRSDHEAGFRSHRRLAETATTAVIRSDRFLVAVSALLMLAMVTAVIAGLALIIVGGPFFPIVFGLILLFLAALLLPRWTRLKRLLENSYRVETTNAPTMWALIDRIAAELGAAKPDVLLFDFSWNAGVTTVGPRPRRVLTIGVPLLLLLTPPQVIALIGHEMGHLKHADLRRVTLTDPARRTFGRLSRLVRPPRISAWDLGLEPFSTAALAVWQLTGGTVSWLLFAAHLGINAAASEDDRAVELRADAAAARMAGTAAAMEMIDVLAMLPTLTGYVQHHVPKGEAAATWRRMLRSIQEREIATAPAWRQLSIRTDASLFASHPAPGRRHQWLATQPATAPAVEIDGEALENEIRPYAEALHRTMLRHVTE
ncbi:M48 family metallopeptidase [Actinoplanes sp. NPDC026619]|uniref:M48 family metallopeptidase n=1 Tax=Actinoplanes sp. NPDC026619 TaxID=3155798 RepID=UPI0034079855